MERIEKIILVVVFLCGSFCFKANAQGKNDLPPDIPAIELLIDAHMAMQKQELRSVGELTSTYGVHESSKSYSRKISDIKSTVNERMSDVNSWLSLAATVMSTGVMLENMVEDYVDFNKIVANSINRQPLVLAIYMKANQQISNEISRLTKQVAEYVGYQSNILKATMAEKRQLINYIRSHISSISMMIANARMQCRIMVNQGLKRYMVEDLFNSNKQIMEGVIGSWKSHSSQYSH